MIKVKFKRKFVLFTTHTFRDEADGHLKTVQKQYHVEPDNRMFSAADAQHASKNTILITFAEGGPYEGTATVEKDCVEVIQDSGPPPIFKTGGGCC